LNSKELAAGSVAQAQVAALTIDICQERETNSKMKARLNVVSQNVEELEKELKQAQERLKLVTQESQTLKAQARRFDNTPQHRYNTQYYPPTPATEARTSSS
jgi:hypothetical protein